MNSIFLGEPPEYIKKFLVNGGQAEDPNLKIPLTFTAEQANSTLKIQKNRTTAPTLNLEYKLNDGAWMTYTQEDTITLANVGDKVQMRATEAGNATFSSSSGQNNNFVMTGKIAAAGNVQSMLDQTMTRMDVPAFCYLAMFQGCTSLTQAPVLPATTLDSCCYSAMFEGCTSLVRAPELPATTLAESCYDFMFSDCMYLTQAPELPATTLANYCYSAMFQGCTSLTQAPVLPATTLSEGCYDSMFQGCSRLTQAPELPATTLANRCYAYMFNYCNVITSANMKKSVNGVYNSSTHGTLNSGITINYVLD